MGESRRRQEHATAAEPELSVSVSPPRMRPDDALAGAGALIFLVECMMLPLVGRAGALTPHYGLNMIAFSVATLLCMGASGAALVLKLRAGSCTRSSFPWISAALVCVSLGLIAALLLGALRR